MSWLSRLKNAVFPGRLDEELAEEMRDHLERRAEELEARGLDRREARRQAALRFGNVTGVRESSRELRLWAELEGSLQDVRYAWRGLLRNPIFAATAVASLGLAIGANTAIYSIVDAAVLRPLPVTDPDRLITLAKGDDDLFSFPRYEELRAAAGDGARLALVGGADRVEAKAWYDDAPYEEVTEQYCSANTFEVMGVGPAAGSLETRDGVVLSYEYWRRRFGGDGAIVGKWLAIDGRMYAIAGVAREGFSGAEPGRFVDVWIPVTMMDPAIFTNADVRLFHVMGRLAPGVERERLASMLRAGLTVNSGAHGVSAFRKTFARPLWILLGVAGCTLLIACANVASLLLARSTARSAEMALRVSLGARRARLVRQLLTESLMISVLAGLCGWAIAGAAAPALVTMVSTAASPVRLELAVDTRMLWFCAGVCGLCALFFGLLPAWQATRSRPMFALRHGAGQSARLRMGRLFVGIQVAFAFCLVTGGSGFLLSLHNLTAVDTGFDAKGVTVLTVSNTQQRDRQLAMLQEVQRRTAALPEVRGAATSWMPLLSGARRAQRVVLPGQRPSEREETFYRVSPGYLATLGTPLMSGRDFRPADNDDEPVPTIVNRAFARRYYGSEAVLGREFRRDDGVRHQIVGVAGNSHFGSLRDAAEGIAYMPMKPPRAFTLYVRSRLDAGSVAKMVERELETLGAGVRVRDVTTLEAIVGRTIVKERLLARIGGSFALLGLVLAAIGLFGLLNYSVTLKTKEIGIRAALGAQRMAICGLVLKDTALLIAGGLVVGLAGSLALMRATESLLFGVAAADGRVIGGAAVIFAGAAMIAAGLPARRAAAIDPVVALRQE
uniref:Permease n=1 Tax=Solibacter usitatus (strain Ellin6076) TaxID=234267 RepID=Q024U5_SOLUE